MKTIFSLIALLTFSACGGLSNPGTEPSEPSPAVEWRFAQAWQAPQGATGYEVCALDPESLNVLQAGSQSPGAPCAIVAPGEWVELWVTPSAGPSPYHNNLSVNPL